MSENSQTVAVQSYFKLSNADIEQAAVSSHSGHHLRPLSIPCPVPSWLY